MGPRRAGGIRIWAGCAAALLALGLAAPASAAELTRDEYRERVEPICKANVEANRKIFQGAKGQVQAGKLKLASKHFFRAQTALGKAVKQLKAVPQPSEDEAKLGKWLGYLEVESSYIGRIGRALAAEDKAKAQLLSVRLNRNSKLANNAVLAFGFNYCRIEPGRFS